MVIDFILAHPILFNFLVICASIYIIFKASDLIVDGISDYAKQLGLSDYIVGFVVGGGGRLGGVGNPPTPLYERGALHEGFFLVGWGLF